MAKSAQALGWIDIETTGLPNEGDGIIDYRVVHVLEVALIVTDLALNKLVGYSGFVRIAKDGPEIEAIKKNDFVRDMHMKNGLIKDCLQSEEAVPSLEVLERDLVGTLESSSFDKGEFLIAGSGIGHFDHPLVKAKMPEFASWFQYAPFDIGVERRVSTILNGNRPTVNPLPQSSRDGVKTHRALDDVEAHLKEAGRHQEFYARAREAGLC